MKNKIKEPNLILQSINNEFVVSAFIAFLLGGLFYLLSIFEGIKTYDISFSNFLKGAGIILIITSIFVIILSVVYNKIKGQFDIRHNEKVDSNMIIVICPKCKNKFSAEPKKIDDFIVIECSHCGIKLKKVDNDKSN